MPKEENEILISLSDIFLILKRGKKKVILGAVAGALFLSYFALTKPIQYESEASFRDRGTKHGGVVGGSSTLVTILGGMGGGANSEAVSLMKSRSLLAPVISKLGLQTSVYKQKGQPGDLSLMMDNISIEYAHFDNRKTPLNVKTVPDFFCRNVYYGEEIPGGLEIKFITDNRFEVYEQKELLGEGKLEQPFEVEKYRFTLVENHSADLPDTFAGKDYIISFLPLDLTYSIISNAFKIDTDKNDRGILKLQYKNIDRHVSSELINLVMADYKRFIKADNDFMAQQQMNYLSNKEDQTNQKVEDLLSRHAAYISSGISTTGFPDSDKEMEFLGQSQREYKHRLLSIELESKRLNSLQTGDYAYYDRYYPTGDADIINNILTRIRAHKQQRDFLALALRKTQEADRDLQKHYFVQNLGDLDEVQQTSEELKQLLTNVQKHSNAIPKGKILDDPTLLVRVWLQKMNETEQALKKAPANEVSFRKEECENCRENFVAYLNNLVRLYDVYGKMIQERLAHQQVPQQEFQGMSLEGAEAIYREFVKYISDLQSEIRQSKFVLKQIEDPEFEITSLSTVLRDPVSAGMIEKASTLSLAVRDQNNRSIKEIDRLKEDLALQRRFLALHVQQTSELKGLHEQLFQEKLRSIQAVTLELTNQQISILENQMRDYLQTRMENLKQERGLINAHLSDLQQQMSQLPKKWVSEQLLKQRLEMNKSVMEEVTKLVESKNIAHNLELVQSAPLDTATPVILPKSPRFVLSAIVGAILGFCMVFGMMVLQTILRGVLATPQNLGLIHQHVAGYLSNRCSGNPNALLDSDLDTLRRIEGYLCAPDSKEMAKKGIPLLLIQGAGPDYNSSLATLLSKKQSKVIVLDLSFSAPTSAQQLPGLLQYLEGESSFPYIQAGKDYDKIASGGICRYSSELVASDGFRTLLNELAADKHYDYILAVTSAIPTSAEATNLLNVFNHVAVTLGDNTLQELEPYFAASKSSKKISFVLFTSG